jgi:heme-degrading monooxygenase HmoA
VPVPVVAEPPAPGAGPIATLTRASIRPRTATQFWKLAPSTQAGLEQAPGCRLAVGLGEAPLVRQATFSLWESADAMERYARAGPHLAAVQAAHQQQFFSESMFARFHPYAAEGVWKGRRYPDALRPQAGEPPLFDASAQAREMADAAV